MLFLIRIGEFLRRIGEFEAMCAQKLGYVSLHKLQPTLHVTCNCTSFPPFICKISLWYSSCMYFDFVSHCKCLFQHIPQKSRWAQCLLFMYVWVLNVIFISVPSQRHLLSNPSVAVFAMDCFAAQEFVEIRRRFWKLCPALHDSSEKPADYSEWSCDYARNANCLDARNSGLSYILRILFP